LDQVEKSTGLVKTGMQAGRREKERTGKRRDGESTNAFERSETHQRGQERRVEGRLRLLAGCATGICEAPLGERGFDNRTKSTYETSGGEIAGGRFPVAIEIERRDWGGTIQTVTVDGSTI
jgi:hypothetical protein